MMTSHRKALTISLAHKDKSMVHWTKITKTTEHKARYRHSQHDKNDLNQDAMIMAIARKPCLVLTDVLKTEKGRAYLDSPRCTREVRKRGQMSSAQNTVNGGKRVSQSCPRERSGGRGARTMGSARKSSRRLSLQETLSSPKRNKERLPLCSRRLNAETGSAEGNDTESDAEEVEVVIDEDSFEDHKHTAAGDRSSEDEEEVMSDGDIGEDCKYTAVVDCGLMVNSGPVQDPVGHVPSVHSPKWKDPGHEEFHGKKRNKESPVLKCNGRKAPKTTPKRSRESVLRLSGEVNRAEGPASKRLCPEDSGGGGESETPESGFVQITVEAAEDGLHSAGSPVPRARESRGSLGPCPSPSHDDADRTGHSEPIVLSSDDEEGGAECQRHTVPFYPPISTDKDADMGGAKETQTKLTQEDVSTQELHSDMDEVVRVVIEDPNVLVPVLTDPLMPSAFSPLPFSALYCGGCRAEANGDIMASDQRILIPLKDVSGEMEVMLTLQRHELLHYSVWELEDVMALGLAHEDEGPPPAAFLLLYVSDSLASTIESDMRKLSVEQQETFSTGKASPFLLLCLKDPLVGLSGTYMRSMLDIVCLNSLAQPGGPTDPGIGFLSEFEDMHTPHLSLDDSLELIRGTGLDPHLLCLVGGQHKMEPAATLSLDWDAAGLKMESVPQDKPDEEEKMGQKDHSAEESSEEPMPVYTVCHRRSRGRYSVSLSTPDSSWTKYKHQGLARRLIQFPPPPSKGGITVTMEDLQCLDSGQFLNDVIIDFYLKYLIQNAPAEVAERSHIFSSFFYKQLTRRDNASEDGASASSQRQRRHQRVKTWTRHVDIFNKDFLFVPVNQESHWYLVVICFPGLEAPRYEVQMSPAVPIGAQDSVTLAEPQAEEETHESKKSNGVTEALHGSSLTENQDTQSGVPENHDDSTKEPPPGPLNCTEQTCKRKTVCKRPCILIMDSLKISHHERVFKLVREYLQSEWEVRRDSTRDFGAEQMKSSHCRVPLQDNTSDCGLYLLQYVESFLKDPVVHFDLPLYLQRWFSRQQVRRKRDEIRDLVLHLCRRQNL